MSEHVSMGASRELDLTPWGLLTEEDRAQIARAYGLDEPGPLDLGTVLFTRYEATLRYWQAQAATAIRMSEQASGERDARIAALEAALRPLVDELWGLIGADQEWAEAHPDDLLLIESALCWADVRRARALLDGPPMG